MGKIPASENEYPSVLFVEGAAPATPSTGFIIAYAKAGGVFAWKDDDGNEHIVGEGDTAAHLADTTDAHDASAISFDPTGLDNTAATELQTAMEDFDAAITAGGGGGGATFKRTVLNSGGNKTTTSTSLVAIDGTNLPYLTFDLAIGDVVRCDFCAQVLHSTTTSAFWDVEVDQPTSSNTRIASGADYGIVKHQVTVDRRAVCWFGLFTATEAGTHGFRPMWGTDSGTLTLANAASADSDTLVSFMAQKLGAPA